MERVRYASGTPWEPLVGYSRAVRSGELVYITGTTATDQEGKLVGAGDPYAQAKQALQNIERALNAVGARLEDVVRTRIYVIDIEAHWREIGRAHSEYFKEILPATSMIEVRKLIDPQMLVEIEADAYCAPPRGARFVAAIKDEDRPWLSKILREAFGTPEIVRKRQKLDASQLQGFIAHLGGQPAGAATYQITQEECELVTLQSLSEGKGVGELLLNAVKENARAHGCKRLWLITTNDNLEALRFYQKRGFALCALYKGAVYEARALKPEIPVQSNNGIFLRDELELELFL